MSMLAVNVNAPRLLPSALGKLLKQGGHQVLGGIVGNLLPTMAIEDPKHIKACRRACMLAPQLTICHPSVVWADTHSCIRSEGRMPGVQMHCL